MSEAAAGRVRLVLPGTPDMARVARATAAVLARREGFTVRDVNALQLGVGARVNDLVEDAGDGGRIELTFDVGQGDVRVDARLVGQPV